jgi:outer membrane protein OmpA-like peptidoglycan-associated protein
MTAEHRVPRDFVSTCRAFALGAAGAVALASVASAQQVISETSDVIIDMSVLDDGGYRPGAPRRPLAPGLAARGGGDLLMPGPQYPQSQFHGLSGQAPPGEAMPAPPREPKAKAAPQPPAKVKTVAKADAPTAPAPPRVPRKAVDKAEAPPALSREAPAAPPPPPAVAMTTPPAAPSAASPSAPPPPPPPAVPGKAPAVAPPVTKGEPPKTAALPPAPATGAPTLQVAFAAGDAKLPNAARDTLKSLADKLKAEENVRLQLLAYAGGGALSASEARRLSLSRALAVRSFLIENGVRSTRIDVRALGDKTTDQPINRVDVHIAER